MFKFKNKKYFKAVCVSVVLLLIAVTTTGVYAALKLQSRPLKNEIAAETKPDPTINETLTEDEENPGYILKKENVTVENDADYSVYVRAAVEITWQNENGDVYYVTPTEDDYNIEFNEDDWTKEGDFWYYEDVLESGEETTALINSCEPIAVSPIEGYSLNVKIAVQTIQSAGTTDSGDVSAVDDAWH